jgi:hypothetical protein
MMRELQSRIGRCCNQTSNLVDQQAEIVSMENAETLSLIWRMVRLQTFESV